uniref:Uncharacterized protein n=1 Tax=Pipistrellus kuhlii TaxID=59472 RepID=A0A7J7VBD0_PIPKU|nr:hypothetical protein mPipKuh1_008488 [Pipistrellus kuhlii]
MLSSCGYLPSPGCLSSGKRRSPMFMVVWVLCVCTCACVHSCLNSTLVLDLSLAPSSRLYCTSRSELHPGKNKVAGAAVPECIPLEVYSVRLTLRLLWTLFGTEHGKRSGLSNRKTSARKRGEPSASLSFASAPPCTLCVHDSWSTT